MAEDLEALPFSVEGLAAAGLTPGCGVLALLLRGACGVVATAVLAQWLAVSRARGSADGACSVSPTSPRRCGVSCSARRSNGKSATCDACCVKVHFLGEHVQADAVSDNEARDLPPTPAGDRRCDERRPDVYRRAPPVVAVCLAVVRVALAFLVERVRFAAICSAVDRPAAFVVGTAPFVAVGFLMVAFLAVAFCAALATPGATALAVVAPVCRLCA